MGMIIGIMFLALVMGVSIYLTVAAGIIVLIGKSTRTRWLRPYIGALLLSVLVAALGLIMGEARRVFAPVLSSLIPEQLEVCFLVIAAILVAATVMLLVLRPRDAMSRQSDL